MCTDNLKLLGRLLQNESPILFIGAGFSIGAKKSDGQDVPDSGKLKELILKEFLNLSDDDDDYMQLSEVSLSQVCQYCYNIYSVDHLCDYLTHCFKNVEPEVWHLKLTNYYWKKIYTTNIDDLIENVYKKNKSELVVQQYKRKFNHKMHGVTELFKLHGSVNNSSEGYVFGLDDYIDSMINKQDYRFSSLSTDMHSESIIIIGSEYDEINIDYYIKLYEKTGYSSSRGKLYFVNPKPSVLLNSKIKRIQGILIPYTAEKFFEFIDALKNEGAKGLEYDIYKYMKDSGYQSLREILTKYDRGSYDSRLYFGYEPKWEDVFEEWDFINWSLIDEIMTIVENVKYKPSATIALWGKAYIGKSVYLKRIGIELHNTGYDVISFSGRSFDSYQFLKFLRKSKSEKIALLIDNASYYYASIKYIMKGVPKTSHLLIVTTTRPVFHLKWRYNLVGENFYEMYIAPDISDDYADTIYSKLDEKGYLGSLKKLRSEDNMISAIKGNNDVMSLLFSLTYGKGFVKRLIDDLKPLLEKDDNMRDLLVSIAVFNKVELPHYPIELLSVFSGDNKKEAYQEIEPFIKKTGNNSIQLRSYFFTKRVLSSVRKDRLVKIVEDILKEIAPLVDDQYHTYWNEINASLIKEKVLRKSLGISSNKIQKMMYGIRNYYNNNFNYWIQLGIAEQRLKDFEKALNHFRQAEAIRPNSYMVQNAIGRNFLKQAITSNSLDKAIIFFEEGQKILIDLIENREEHQARAFATHCLLYEKIEFVKKFDLKLSNEEIVMMDNYLKRILEKDPNDIMARQVNNRFVAFLMKIKKLNMINLKMQDISRIKEIFSEYNIDIDDMISDSVM